MYLKCLNLGCGKDIKNSNDKETWVNVDYIRRKGIQICNLNKLPFPFKDKTFDVVYASHVLEHLEPDLLELWVELHRILKPKGKLLIKVPHFSGSQAFDPYHRRFFRICTFISNNNDSLEYELFSSLFEVKSYGLRFTSKTKRYLPYSYFVEWFFNSHRSLLMLYEKTFLVNLFTFEEIYLELERK